MSDSPWSTTAPDSRRPQGSPRISPYDALAPGTRLDEFEILSVLGIGAFGIVYLAYDHVLVRRVAIKEYMPAALAGRRDGLPIALRSPEFEETFERGLESFLNEARLLASFDHPSLVKVHRFWRGNGTAYMAMQHYPGETLKDVRLRMDAPPSEEWLLGLVAPLLDALDLLHAQGVFHRDISPDNILILPEGRPVLLDFGSARRVIGTGSQFLSAVLKPPFAPVEQYASETEMRQGPWTDLYALGATLYFALMGRAPTPSVVRAVDDTLGVLATSRDERFAAMHGPLLATIDWMLAMSPAARPRSVEAVRRVLRGEQHAPPAERVGGPAASVAAGRENARAGDDDEHDGDSDRDGETADDGDRADDGARPKSARSLDEAPARSASLADDAAPEDAAAVRSTPDRRLALAALAVLGALVLAIGGWTLNRSGSASPALASLAAALRPSTSASAATAARRETAWVARSPASVATVPAPVATITPAVATTAVPPIASAPSTAVRPLPPFLSSSADTEWIIEREPDTPQREAVPRPAETARLVEAAEDRGSPRPRERGWSSGRPADSPLRLPVQNVAARTKNTPARASASCDGLAALSRVLCTLRACKSQQTSADPKCVRSRQVELARQRRMERE